MNAEKEICLLRERQIRERFIPTGRTTFWKLTKEPDFPKPVQLAGGKAWRSDEIQAWIRSRQHAKPKRVGGHD